LSEKIPGVGDSHGLNAEPSSLLAAQHLHAADRVT
jgi:hypothetical protein